MSKWLGLVVFLALSKVLSPATVPMASPAVDLARYLVVLYVDRAQGDDIKGDDSLRKPLVSVVRALESAASTPSARCLGNRPVSHPS